MKFYFIAIVCILLTTSCTYLAPSAGKKPEKIQEKPEQPVRDSISTGKKEPVKEFYVKADKVSKALPEKKTTQKNPLISAKGNIRALTLSAKSNGTMLKIDTATEFSEKDVAVSVSMDNFLNITIYRGRLDKSFPDNLKSFGDITDISYFAFESSVQLTIKLKKKVVSKSVMIKPDKIIISLFENE